MSEPITAEHVERALGQLIEPGRGRTVEFTELARALAEAAGVDVRRVVAQGLMIDDDGYWSEEEIEAEDDPLNWAWARAVWCLVQHLGRTNRVISCSNPTSMVSGYWGVYRLEVGNRGYLYQEADHDLACYDESVDLYCWAPVEDRAAFEKAFLDMYAAEWYPLKPGREITVEWCVDDGLMIRAVRRTVEAGDSWADLAETVGECLAGILEIWSAAELAEERSLDLATAERLIEAFRGDERPKQAWYDALDEREKDFVAWLLLRC